MTIDGARAIPHADLVLDAGDAAAVEHEARRLALAHLEPRLALDRLLHRGAIAALSHCARDERTAGPREALSVLNWIAARRWRGPSRRRARRSR